MKYLNALNKINGVGPQKMRRLLDYFEKGENIWKASLEELKASKLGDILAEKIVTERKTINPNQEWEKLEKENIRILTLDSPQYPALLKEIPNPPYLIYIRGNIDLNSSPMISIVGSRKFTSYGSQVAYSFAKELAKAGFIIVSGMALGIDSIAHRGALDAGGQTIAVLGNSLDDNHLYPRANFNLSREIMNQGLLLSDYPIETQASEFTFPARNRLIAGLSLGTLVIEAGEKSGTLITSELALEFNREIFSIPGSIFSSQSAGTNGLIKKGARMVTSVKDILEELDLAGNKALEPTIINKNPATQEEEIILKIISTDPLHIDNIAKMSKLSMSQVSSVLAMMEIKGWVKNIGGQNYISL